MKLRILFAILLLLLLSCAMPVLVPTAVPLPTPTPTWTLLPSNPATPVPTETPAPIDPTPTAAPTDAPAPTETDILFVCDGAPETRMVVGQNARVTFTDGIPLRVRESPAVLPDNITTQIPEGTEFFITAGPVCAPIPDTSSAYVFWQIEIEETGLVGWVAEGDETAYYIEAMP